MKLYNTLTRQVEVFTPLTDNKVGLYACGPTVYDRAHIGNMRTYLLTDLLVRLLRFLGYELTAVMNITDIEDKMIARAEREGITLSELAERNESVLFEDLAKLNIQLLDVYPRATEHFPEMKQLLNTLVEKGFAYNKDGEVYFDISKFKDYGKLSQLDKRTIKPGARVAVDEYDKNNANDFVLWKVDKITKEHLHELTKGSGRPGWHLECSAMSMKYLGPTIDIHIGGTDLIFPHHENEIAQSEAATEKPFVRYFVHGEHILIDNQKMAKSLGNVYSIGDIEERGIDPLAYRYLILSSHYRSRLNFTWDALDSAVKTLQHIQQLAYRQTELSELEKQAVLKAGFAALEDDLNTPKLFALLHETNSYDMWLAFEPILGLGLAAKPTEQSGATQPELTDLIKRYQQARASKDYTTSDVLRAEIVSQGYLVEDTPDGPRIIPKN